MRCSARGSGSLRFGLAFGAASRAELPYQGFESRLGTKRAELVHQMLDPVEIDGPWLVGALAMALAARTLVRRVRR